MVATYSEALRRLNRLLEFFFVVCAAATLIGVIRHDWWFTAVWLAAGFIAVVIEASVNQSAVSASPPGDNEFANELAANDNELAANELADQHAFGEKFLKFSSLLAATVLATGFVLGNLWWGNLLAAAVAWFASMFGIALLCGPRKNREGHVDGSMP